MAIYKTPGVYVEEISLLPPSVAQVETAIPAFIGYTQLAEKDGQDLKNEPTRISSMLDYQQYFGGARTYAPGEFTLELDDSKGYKVITDSFKITKLLNMYNSVRHYFDNGGGPCYIVSVGDYNATIGSGNENDATNAPGLRVGVKALEKYDEPTIIVLPDAANLTDNDFYALQQMAVAQAGLLQDRIALLDLREYNAAATGSNAQQYFPDSQMSNVYQEFRNRIGINDLKYAAAYTPWVFSSYTPDIPYAVLKANVKKKGGAAIDFTKATSNTALNALVQRMEDASGDQGKVKNTINALLGGATSLTDRYQQLKSEVQAAANDADALVKFTALMVFVRSVVTAIPTWKGASSLSNVQLVSDLDAYAKDTSVGLAAALKALLGFENNADVKALISTAYDYTSYDAAAVNVWWKGFPASAFDTDATIIAHFKSNARDYGAAKDKSATLAAVADLNGIFSSVLSFLDKITNSAAKYSASNQTALYNSHPVIVAAVTAIQTRLSIVPPCGAVAGIYAKTDRERGVWKAPANSSLNSVTGPVTKIDNATQDSLNVDVEAGKSINAVRAFSGKGTLIWGARTLDGNSNEWRYINVRRLFNMVEESVKKSTAPFVFESNDANTWVKVKGMIENYLTTLWRQGALAGAKPEHAFFVRVGLGQTMTSQDILEGRMNVEIGMAAVRPAEFIILRFSHKLQES
jgi:phage tail sheath protein FI